MSEKMFTQDEVKCYCTKKRLAEEKARLSNDVNNEYKAQCEEMKAQFNAFAMKAAKKELFFTLQANKAIEPEGHGGAARRTFKGGMNKEMLSL